jgi:hypothetical protein
VSIKHASLLSVLLLLLASNISAQTETGTISGTVTDQQGGVVAGAHLRLVSESTGAVREANSDELGNFAFNAVLPGAYTLAAEHSGFKKYQKKSVPLQAHGHVALGQIVLELGGANEMVTVTAEGAMLQTASSERSGEITDEQVRHLTVINRDFTFLASLLPGVVANTSSDSQGFRGGITFNVNGGRAGQNNITVDGVPMENSNTTNTNTFISMDAISTVKIESSTYQAEFGRKPGAAIQAVTKSGTLNYHGGIYWYQRNEAFNAASFFNKREGRAEVPYRYISAGANFGGPVYIPGLIKHGQNKLFFFFTEEQQRELRPQSQQTLRMPTALERTGDFSQSLDDKLMAITLQDPKNCGTSRNQNCLLDSRRVNPAFIDPNFRKYFGLFPLPTINDPVLAARKTYNYVFQESNVIPKHNEVLRLDYNITPKTSVYGVLTFWSEEEKGNSVPAGSSSWGWLPSTYAPKSKTLNLAGSHFFSPTLILEASLSASRWTEAAHPRQQDLDARNRASQGIPIPQFHPENNPLNLLPAATFGGISNGPSVSYDGRFPIRGAENVFTLTTTVTKIHGSHTAKAGVFIEQWRQVKGENGTFTGSFDFTGGNSSVFTTALGNTGNAFANALLGNFNNYTESTTRPPLFGRYNGLEWFVQDNWKVNRKLTLDLGLRFGWAQPFHDPSGHEAGFVSSLFNPGNVVALYTAATAPARSALGAIIPGSGDPLNGTVNRLTDPGYPAGLRTSGGIKVGPRVGFAYDPFGKSATVIRGGFGLFHDFRERDNFAVNISRDPPLQLNPNIPTQNVGSLLAAGGYTFPSDTLGFERDRKLPYVVDYSLGVQQSIGFRSTLDVAYVGSLGRHLFWRRNVNSIPFGTVPASGAAPVNTYRPYLGYSNIRISEYAATSNYHSLQVAVNRRFAKNLQFGGAWTWSKAMGFANGDTDEVSNLLSPRIWNYGRESFDRTHIFKASFTWDLPKVSALWSTGFTRRVLDDWTISGIATFQSGAPAGIGFGGVVERSGASPTSATTWSGSPTDGSRVVILRSPVLPKDQQTFSRYFDTGAIAMPTRNTPGNAPKDIFREPGINNWDLSLFKQIALRGERVNLQFRAEAYNAFNHTQFSSVDTTARFDASGNQINARFGEIIAARPNRRMQLALRLSF